jgi:NTP pyrophosphatase (non-canonical NTP hydrolase)
MSRPAPAKVEGEPTLRELSALQWDWVERMGWHNKTHLEAMALIVSEAGEAINELRGEAPTENYGEELADLILRTLDEAKNSGIDITAVLLAKMKKNEERGTRGRRI